MSGPNPDLPILDELGAEFTALVKAAYTAEGEGPAARRRAPLPVASPKRERGAQARRIGRRASIVLVLLCAIGGAAFAALRGGDGPSQPAHTAPTPLGRAGDGAWSFSAYRDEGRLCTLFVPRGGELSGVCDGAPVGGRVRTGGVIADGRRYLFGVAGPGVDRVSVSVAEAAGGRGSIWRTAAGRVHVPLDRAAARDAGFPVGDAWFVLDLGPAGDAGRARVPAIVTPLDARGRRAGPPYVDCSLGVIGEACKRRIEAAAAGNQPG